MNTAALPPDVQHIRESSSTPPPGAFVVSPAADGMCAVSIFANPEMITAPRWRYDEYRFTLPAAEAARLEENFYRLLHWCKCTARGGSNES